MACGIKNVYRFKINNAIAIIMQTHCWSINQIKMLCVQTLTESIKSNFFD